MESGLVGGQGVYLNWVAEAESPGWITLGKEHLATGALIHGPQLASARCRDCGLGLFES